MPAQNFPYELPMLMSTSGPPAAELCRHCDLETRCPRIRGCDLQSPATGTRGYFSSRAQPSEPGTASSRQRAQVARLMATM